MDTSQQVTVTSREKAASVVVVQRRQRWSIAEKRRMVEATLVPGASVARVARTEGVNTNQLFGWRRLYLAGRLGQPKPGVKLLPVRVSESLASPVTVERSCSDFSKPQTGTIHLELRHAKVRIEGGADLALVRVLLECLTRAQLAMLLEGIDWRRPERTWEPQLSV